jgi:hypothetical protein
MQLLSLCRALISSANKKLSRVAGETTLAKHSVLTLSIQYHTDIKMATEKTNLTRTLNPIDLTLRAPKPIVASDTSVKPAANPDMRRTIEFTDLPYEEMLEAIQNFQATFVATKHRELNVDLLCSAPDFHLSFTQYCQPLREEFGEHEVDDTSFKCLNTDWDDEDYQDDENDDEDEAEESESSEDEDDEEVFDERAEDESDEDDDEEGGESEEEDDDDDGDEDDN